MSVTREIKIYRGLYNTGEKIDFTPVTETVTGEILETWYSVDVSGGIPAKGMNVETTDGYVYPMFAIHGGRTYYYNKNTQESITLKGVLLNHEIDNSWIVVYAPKGNYGIGVPRPEVSYTENQDVRIHIGNSVENIENDVLEQSEDFDFFEIDISNGAMSDNFFTYGGTFSPTCTIEMMPTEKITQGNFIRLEFKLYGTWQNLGVFYIKEPPESTSEYVSVSGIGMLEMCGDFIAKDATKPEGIWKSSILSIKGLVHYIYDTFGVPVLFNFDVNKTETQRNYYQNSSIIIPHGIEENEMESNGVTYSGYTMTGGFTSVRNAVSKLAVALYSNAIEISGAIVIMHNDYDDFKDCGCFEDDTIEEPVQRMNAYYCPYKVDVECQQMQMAEFTNKVTDANGTVTKYDTINAPALMDTTKTVNILNEKVTDTERKIIYYPVTVSEDDGGWCDVTNLSPTYWGQMDFAKYPIHNFATLMALNKPFYYYPIETELNGYSPFVYAGAGIKIRINGTVRFVYVGTLDLSWEGGMFSMSISSPADIDLYGGNDSTTSSGASSSAGIGTLSAGVLNSMKKAKLLDDKSIFGEKIADSTIENANIADATIGYEKVNKSFITDLTADNAYIENLTAKVAELGYLKADSADLKYATIKNLEAVDGKIGTLETKAITTDNLEAKVATLGYLSAESADAKYATIERLTALDGKIDTLSSKAITTENLSAKVADLGYLSAESAVIGYAKIDFSNVGTQVVSSSMIIDGAVTNEKVANLSANKITSGTIDASKITVTNLNADNITVGTINGKRIGNGSLSLDKLAEEVPTKEYLDSVEKNLQGQIDGAIETFTKTEIPTLNNEPANNWKDDITRKKHIGDICYVVNPSSSADGYCYRFADLGTSENHNYSWVIIKDSDVTKALQDIIDINGEITGIKKFDESILSWKVETDSELSSLKTRTSNLETDIGTKVSSSVFNELKQEVDENSASITALSSTVSKKADGSTVEALTNTVNEVKQTANSNTLSISSMQTEISKKADGSNVTELSTRTSRIEQKTNEISQTVSTKVGADEIISKINQTAETITIDASKLNLTGYVTVENLKGSGTTEINGANIMTGSISADKIDVVDLFAQNITATSMTITGDSKFGPFGVSSDLAEIVALDTDHNQVSIGTKYLKFYSGVIGTETLRIMDIQSDNIYMTSGSGKYSNYGLGNFEITNDNQKAWIRGDFNEIQFGDNRSSESMLARYMQNGITFTGVSSFDIGTNLTINENILIARDGISQKNSSGAWVKNIQVLNSSNNFVLGYGGFYNKTGATNIYGNRILLLSNSDLRSTRTLTKLWSGAHFMNANQTESLSDKVSNQLNGIVLSWSFYSSGAKDYFWNHVFIPKGFVASNAGNGISMILSGSPIGYKYVYVNDQTIAGTSTNESASTTASGITMSPNKYVLRYVWGV